MKKYQFCLLLFSFLVCSCAGNLDNSGYIGGPETANFNSGGQKVEDESGKEEDDELSWEDIEITPEVTSDSEVRIMTFNVRGYTTEENSQNNWANRRKAIPVMIKTTNPTTFGVQEAKRSFLTWIQSNCPDYQYTGEGNGGGTSGEYSAIFYNTKEVNLLNSGTFWLSETPDKVSYGFGAKHRRIATWAVFEKKATGERFFHINTHLDFAEQVQIKEVEVIAERIKLYNPEGYPAAFTGDMNVQHNSPAFNPIRKEGWKNSRTEARETDDSGTYNGWGASGKIIDIIFIKDFKALKYKVVTEQFVGVQYISDHYPVYSVLEFPVKDAE